MTTPQHTEPFCAPFARERAHLEERLASAARAGCETIAGEHPAGPSDVSEARP